ncbi:Macrolide export protein MacA [Gammaproteobacteria bacterium]
MKKITRKQLIIIVISLAVAGLGFFLIKHVFFKHPVTYITADVSKRDIEEKVLASGILNASKTVKVGAQVSGQLKKLYVTLGDRVKTGQLLAEIDPVVERNELKSAEAAVEGLVASKFSRQALLKQYELAYRRQLKMVVKGASSRADFEKAQTQLDSTKAEIAALDAQIRQAKITVDIGAAKLDFTKIIAPIDGIVVSIATEEGQTVVSAQTATTILELANLDTITVKAGISEADVMRIYPGQNVYFTTIGDTDNKYYSKLRAIEPGPNSSKATGSPSESGQSSGNAAIYYNGLFDVPNPGHKLRISMTVQVSIVLQEAKQALCIPASVLENKGKDGYYTVKVLRNNIPEDHKVKIGITDNVYTQVLSGLQIGDKIILGDSLSAEKNHKTGGSMAIMG